MSGSLLDELIAHEEWILALVRKDTTPTVEVEFNNRRRQQEWQEPQITNAIIHISQGILDHWGEAIVLIQSMISGGKCKTRVLDPIVDCKRIDESKA